MASRRFTSSKCRAGRARTPSTTTPRIAFLRYLIARLESPPDTPFLGQLKTLLGVPRSRGTEPPEGGTPNLPVARDVAVPWDIAYFLEFLKPKLGECPDKPFRRAQGPEQVEGLGTCGTAEFLTALVAALNDRAKLPNLDRFPEWRDQPPVPLYAPWLE